MVCKNCINNPVIKLTNNDVSLCKGHFIRYFEKKVMKTIAGFSLIKPNEKIGVAVSGGKDSLTVLHILSLVKEKKPIEIEALLIDEGIKDYRDKTILDAKKFCNEHKIKLKIVSYKKEFGYSLDEMLKVLKIKPCSICGVFRRYLLNKKSKDFGYDKLATGHNLDDEAQSVMMNQFRSNMETSARLGPITGIVEDKRFIKRIKPLYLVTEKEVATYSFIKGFTTNFVECPNSGGSYRNHIRDFINDFENKFPGSKHGIINSFLQILPILKKEIKFVKIQSCKNCGEATSKELCQACVLVYKLKSSVKQKQSL